MCDTPRQYEAVGSLGQLRWLALDHCGKTGLSRFGGLANLRAPRAKARLCLHCDAAKLKAHEAEFA